MKRLPLFTALLAIALVGCSTKGPITGRRYADLAVKPTELPLVMSADKDAFRFGRYTLVEQFPNPGPINGGMSSQVAFDRFGKATGMEMNLSSNPPAKDAMKSNRDIPVEWHCTGYWSLARRRSSDLIETLDISIDFVKVTRTKAEIQQVGSPFFRGTDIGWFIDKISVVPMVHNLKATAPRR